MAVDPFTTHELFLDPQHDSYHYLNAFVGNCES